MCLGQQHFFKNSTELLRSQYEFQSSRDEKCSQCFSSWSQRPTETGCDSHLNAPVPQTSSHTSANEDTRVTDTHLNTRTRSPPKKRLKTGASDIREFFQKHVL
ncbi:hypothetical protein BaRGS_00016406 [Batillaria attramentaria]|uniref:Uncharacterized protein n=1 Tax=Batillaria attramentaria TaxID=370345 RepID=A0ABD0KZS6_9CAEN